MSSAFRIEEFGERLLAHGSTGVGDAAPDSAATSRPTCASGFAGYKVPRLVELRAELPRDDSGKIYKRRLRDPYWQDHETRI